MSLTQYSSLSPQSFFPSCPSCPSLLILSDITNTRPLAAGGTDLIIIRAASSATLEEPETMHGLQRRATPRPFFRANATQTIFASILLIITPLLAFTSGPAGREASAAAQYDVVIRKGLVVGGTGRAGFNADVGINRDPRAFGGRLPKGARARRPLDGRC